MGTFLEECRMDLGFKGCEKSLRRIMEKQLGFEFKKIDNKLKIEQKKVKKMKSKPIDPPKVMVGNKSQMVKKQPMKQRESVSVSIQTQPMHTVQTVPILDISGMQRTSGMEEMSQVHR